MNTAVLAQKDLPPSKRGRATEDTAWTWAPLTAHRKSAPASFSLSHCPQFPVLEGQSGGGTGCRQFPSQRHSPWSREPPPPRTPPEFCSIGGEVPKAEDLVTALQGACHPLGTWHLEHLSSPQQDVISPKHTAQPSLGMSPAATQPECCHHDVLGSPALLMDLGRSSKQGAGGNTVLRTSASTGVLAFSSKCVF